MRKVIRIITGLVVGLFLMLPIFAEEAVSPFDDPNYSQQWALEAIDWLPVWQQGLTGKDVKIGIIDTGAYSQHEDLQGAALQGSNFIGAESETFSDDQIGHGTFVAGIIAAQPNNGKGIVGIAPDAEIYVYRAYDGKLPPILAAVDQAIADGCRIINFSLGATEAALKENYSLLQQGIQKVQDAGILAVAAAGNSRPNATVTLYPAGFAGVIGVGSVNENLERSSFSQTNSSVFVVAPGENLVSLSNKAADKYVTGGGTSYAAPVVTALAALALDYDPTLTPTEIMEMLRLTATDLGESGYDTSYGHGLVNASAMIEGLKSHFPVRYQLMGGAFSEAVPMFYSVREGVQQLPVPMCEGHDFAGWYADEERTVAVEQIAAGTTDAQTIFAKWEANGQGLCRDEAGDGDHLCEICGADGASSCEDPDRDHACDECGLTVGAHEAAEGTHACGHCGETITECADVDKNHVCDICGATVGIHEAAAGAHVCDYCGETMSECADSEDLDAQCDVCGQNLLQIRIEGSLLVVENKANVQLIIAEYDLYGKMIGVHIVTEGAKVPICGPIRVFALNNTFVPLLSWLEVNTDSTAVQ